MTSSPRPALISLLLTAMLCVLPQCTTTPTEAIHDNMICHEVFFELTDPSDENVARLIRGCETLRGIPTVVSLATGARHPGLVRDVNQTDFQVGLHVTFENQADHDVYQEHAIHLAFIEAHKDMWASVRVFDNVSGVPATDPSQP